MRGLAIVLSVLYHYTGRFGEIYGHPAPLVLNVPEGYGSDLFFAVSGYVTAMTVSSAAARVGLSEVAAWARAGRRFLLARLFRLYPAFVVGSMTTFTVVRIFRLPGREAGVRDAMANFTMLPGHLGFRQIDGAYWSLEVQFIFFAIAALLLALGRPRALSPVLALLVGLHLVGVVVTDQFAHFLIGAIFFESSRGWRFWHGPALGLALLDLCHGGSPVKAVLMGAVALTVFAASRRAIPGLCNPVLMYLGGISYAVYLTHQNLGYVIIRAGYRLGWNGNICALIAVVASLLVATALTYLVERPANRWLRARFGLATAGPGTPSTPGQSERALTAKAPAADAARRKPVT